jgi:hypothetical protein
MDSAADFVDAAETPLEGRGPRSLPFGSGFAIALGSLITGFGFVFGFGVSTVALLAPKGLPREQRWLIPPVLAFMILIGLGLIRAGLADQRRAARGKELAARLPDQPWFADWHWDPQGAFAESALGATGIFVTLFILLVMAPFNVLWLYALDPHQDDKTRVLALMVLIPDFFIYLLVRGVTSLVKDRVRFGRPRLQFELFPFFRGETLEVRVTAKMFAGQEGVVATLRCIEERTMVAHSRGGRRSVFVRPYQLYLARQAFPGRFAGEDVPLRIDLPAQPPTELLRQPPRYWELEIRGGPATSAVSFVVPVYARPGVTP